MARRSARQGKQASGLERVETIVNPPTGQSNVEPASLDIHADITPSEDGELLAWLGRQGSSSMPQTQSTETAVDPIVLARAPSNRDSPRPHYSTSCEKKVFQWINGKCRLVRSGDDDSGHVSLPQNATRIMPPRASKTAYSKTSTFPGLLEQALAVGHQLELDGHYFAMVVLKSSERRPYKSDSIVYQKISHALADAAGTRVLGKLDRVLERAMVEAMKKERLSWTAVDRATTAKRVSTQRASASQGQGTSGMH